MSPERTSYDRTLLCDTWPRRKAMGRIGSMLLLVVLLAGACSSAGEAETAVPSKAPERATSALVGTWERETTCEELVSVLTDAGLERWVLESVAGNGFLPGVTRP